MTRRQHIHKDCLCTKMQLNNKKGNIGRFFGGQFILTPACAACGAELTTTIPSPPAIYRYNLWQDWV
jgi:hypothetical protein